MSSGQPSPTDQFPNTHLIHHQPFSDYNSASASASSSSFYDNAGGNGPSRSVSGTQQYQYFQYQHSPQHQQQQQHLNFSPYLSSLDSGIVPSSSSSSCNVFSPSSSSHGLPQSALHLYNDPAVVVTSSSRPSASVQMSVDPDEYLLKFHNRIKAVLVEAGRANLTADTCAERVNSVIRSFPVELKTYQG